MPKTGRRYSYAGRQSYEGMSNRSIEREVSDEAIRQYLDGIGLYDLLTAEDEVRLAKAIETGHKAEIALETEKEPAKCRKLGQMVRLGEDARQNFIRSNLRLVVSIAKRYGHAKLPFLDLVQEGNLGLIGPSKSSSIARDSNSPPTQPGGSVRQSPGRSLTRVGPSGFLFT